MTSPARGVNRLSVAVKCYVVRRSGAYPCPINPPPVPAYQLSFHHFDTSDPTARSLICRHSRAQFKLLTCRGNDMDVSSYPAVGLLFTQTVQAIRTAVRILSLEAKLLHLDEAVSEVPCIASVIPLYFHHLA